MDRPVSLEVMSRTVPHRSPVGGHPFRQTLRFAALKQKVRREEGDPEGPAKRISMQDLREFLMAYCACFLATSTFIA